MQNTYCVHEMNLKMKDNKIISQQWNKEKKYRSVPAVQNVRNWIMTGLRKKIYRIPPEDTVYKQLKECAVFYYTFST